ncbi:glycosyltransferase [Alloscardovia venturai]|uniref:Glycosyltransferase n=1 Tax=Alloscardovia venturai TaxID=1769421 RepID=A0ABW2Y524_9BIFI
MSVYSRKATVKQGDGEQSEEGKDKLSIALVVDSLGGSGNGTSNSAQAFANELERCGVDVRLVGVGSDRDVYAAQSRYIPVVSWFARQHKMEFAQPDLQLFDKAFQGVDVVHIYMPFEFGRAALAYCKRNGIAVTAGFHVQPENICASAPFLNVIPHIKERIYNWMWRGFYEDIDHIHVPSYMEKAELERAGYNQHLHVFSNGYDDSLFDGTSAILEAERTKTAKNVRTADHAAHSKFIIVSSGRLSAEKDHETLIKAVALSKHKKDIELRIAGAGPLRKKLTKLAQKQLGDAAGFSIGFVKHDEMPEFLSNADLCVHASLADIEGISVIEAMAMGVVPVIAHAPKSAASDFALCPESLFEPHNPEDLARAIDWWLDNPELRERWGREYAQVAKARYSIKNSVQTFIQMAYEAYAQTHNF